SKATTAASWPMPALTRDDAGKRAAAARIQASSLRSGDTVRLRELAREAGHQGANPFGGERGVIARVAARRAPPRDEEPEEHGTADFRVGARGLRREGVGEGGEDGSPREVGYVQGDPVGEGCVVAAHREDERADGRGVGGGQL